MYPNFKAIKPFVSVLLLCVCLLNNAQQNGAVFYQLTSKNGLSSNQVTDVLQDQYGYYWISTVDGLNRFNGSSCKVYRNIRNDSTSLSNNLCVTIKEDKRGDIWVGTLNGLNRFNRVTGKFQRYYFDIPGISRDLANSITGLEIDADDNIWVSSYALWKFNIRTNKWTSFYHHNDLHAGIPKGNISGLKFEKENNRLWMLNYQGSVFLDLKTGDFQHKKNNPGNIRVLDEFLEGNPYVMDREKNIWFYHKKTNGLGFYSQTKNEVTILPVTLQEDYRSMNVDAENRIWINYWWSGTEIYDPGKKKLNKGFLDAYHSKSAVSRLSGNLFVDRENNYWICSRNGISIYNQQAQYVNYYVLNIKAGKQPETGFEISSMVEWNKHLFLVGTSAGLFRYDLDKRSADPVELAMPQSQVIRCLTLGPDSVLWIGGERSIVLYHPGKKRVIRTLTGINNVQFLMKGYGNQILAGSWNDGVYVYSLNGDLVNRILPGNDPGKSLSHQSVFGYGKMKKDSGIYIGYNGGNGFSAVYFNNKAWQHYQIVSEESSFGSSNTVSTIKEDAISNLWLGTYGNGLFYFDRGKNTYRNYTQSDGLIGNFINSVLEDSGRRLWISTNNGINLLSTKNGEIRMSDIELSFPSQDFVANGQVISDGRFLFFAGNKFVLADPSRFLFDSNPSEILVSSFKVFEKEKFGESLLYKSSGIKLLPKENFFSIEYSLLKPDPGKKIHYAYKLDGFDMDWIDVGERRVAYYTNVPPGDYTFHVRAADASGNWNFFSDPLAIQMKRPLYARTWFIAFIGLGVLAIIYFIYNYRISQLKKMLALRTHISQDLHDEVASTLSGIRLYSELAKKQISEHNEVQVRNSLDIIASNSAEMKEKLRDIVWTINPSNDRFGILLNKLNSYANELTRASGMVFRMTMEKEIDTEKINMHQRRNIYMICKEAINNAVKYSSATNLELSVSRYDHSFQIQISDNGIGFDSSQTYEGNGLLNMKARAKEVGGVINIESSAGNGTRVVFKLKL